MGSIPEILQQQVEGPIECYLTWWPSIPAFVVTVFRIMRDSDHSHCTGARLLVSEQFVDRDDATARMKLFIENPGWVFLAYA